MWFVIEYFFIYPSIGVDPAQAEHFKSFQYGQSIAAKLWAAGFVVSGALLYTSSKARSDNPGSSG